MSIESSITKIAEALGTVAQAGNAIAASIDRYCELTQAEAVSANGDAEMREVINKAVAEFEAEHEEYQAETAAQTKEAEPDAEEDQPEKVEPEAEDPNTQSAEPVTFDEAKTVVIDTVAAKGKPAVAAIFKQLGAKNLPELEPSQYGELVALCKAA